MPLMCEMDRFQAEKRDTSFLKERIDRIREDRERGGSEGKTSRSERRRAVAGEIEASKNVQMAVAGAFLLYLSPFAVDFVRKFL
ncbi:hypothetical protein N7475_000676 [Penicillium sp. IBT 31633x]|nr:hypothetical protein N7475_000676 [Penicillium sp. IBT 31633x]